MTIAEADADRGPMRGIPEHASILVFVRARNNAAVAACPLDHGNEALYS
jgi:hypothetical protein